MVYLMMFSTAQTTYFKWLVNNQLERMQEESVMAQFEILSQHFISGTKENHKLCQSRQMVAGMTFELMTSNMTLGI